MTCLDKNDVRQNEKDKTFVVIKCFHGLAWNVTYHGGSLFSWIGKSLPLPQGVVHIPGIYLAIVAICWNNCFVESYGSRISAPLQNNALVVGTLFIC